MLGKQNCELAQLDCLRGANEPESGFSPIAFAKSSERTEGACSIPRQSGDNPCREITTSPMRTDLPSLVRSTRPCTQLHIE
jgi:hypothetical protein